MTATQRGISKASPEDTAFAPTTQETPMLGRLACSLGFHRVITRSDKPKNGAAGPIAIVRGFCYRPACKFEFARSLKLGRDEL